VVALCEVTGPVTLVLGSAQPDVALDATRTGGTGTVEVVRRTSGGGAVLVAPGSQVWVDVWLPRADPLWDDDIVRSSRWLGRAWQDALCDLGVEDLCVHEDRFAKTMFSDLICFAGLGPGELQWRSRKLVGMSQRRTRHGARFNSSSPLGPVGEATLEMLDLDPIVRRQASEMLARDTTCLSEAVPARGDGPALLDRVEQALVRRIESAHP
jgi:lipoate---protein ligase